MLIFSQTVVSSKLMDPNSSTAVRTHIHHVHSGCPR